MKGDRLDSPQALLIGGNLALCVGVFAIATSFLLGAPGAVEIVCLCAIMFAFSIGAGR